MDYAKNALIAFHTCCKHPQFAEICNEKHKLKPATFNPYSETAAKRFVKAFEVKDWDTLVNQMASVTAFVGAFPERAIDFKCLIVPLIKTIAEKTEVVRKNAAVLLAKLCQDEENKKCMQANHGTEVLMSLQGNLVK